MHGIVKFAGGLTVLVGLAALVFGIMVVADAGPGSVMVLGFGLSVILSGAVLYCFGAIVEHLAAIRSSNAELLAVLRGSSR
ncbi:hypothetical protein JYP46_04680 [Nitratireductor aquimarinus]|uniref:hypothetical protein n=1 Tax=Alphaproteobacteria TaxID=28211 RepID=UPI0019D3413C|nr:MULTISPECIES: hypothetical protein [Alphaproteobacteria]MBN7756109.1 hypothetical protein [Nitratireductor aquimarinus]MBY5998867.1 hypothetical protein [Tritonibacter mobilis]MBY6020895.1 hypothetical protein [Nitratireductor sp. DP7N14-4]